jgi:hypothetical protein
VQQFYGYKQTLPRTEIVQEEKKNRRNYKVDVLLASTGFLKSLARNRAKKKLALVHDIYLNKSLRLFNEDLIGLISMFFLFRPSQIFNTRTRKRRHKGSSTVYVQQSRQSDFLFVVYKNGTHHL